VDPLMYYATQSPITNPGEYVGLFSDLPHTIAGLRRVVQGIYIHYMAGGKHGYEIPTEKLSEIDTRYVEKMLARISELDGRPLTEPRPPEKCLVGCCRDAAVLLCSMLRHHGLPARTRMGFESYSTDTFGPGFHVDHEIVEYWDMNENHWRFVDPDLLDTTVKERDIQFDVYDVPRDQFLVAGKAWQMCRAGKANPDTFGIGDLRGLWYIRGSLIQDLALQNKMELLHWDEWGLMLKDIEAMTEEEWRLLDRVAVLTQAGNEVFHDMREVYERDTKLRVSRIIKSYSPVSEPREVTLQI
jgi:hypothetical protein